MKNFLKEAVSVIPSKRQLDWFEVGFYAFIHFGVNTYTDQEWGHGDEPEEISVFYTYAIFFIVLKIYLHVHKINFNQSPPHIW